MNQRFGCRRCQLQIDPDALTFWRTPQTIRRPICGLGTVTERNRKCLLQKNAVNLSSLTGRQHWLADRRTGGKHRSSERPPLSATERSAIWKLNAIIKAGLRGSEADIRNSCSHKQKKFSRRTGSYQGAKFHPPSRMDWRRPRDSHLDPASSTPSDWDRHHHRADFGAAA